MEIFGIVLFILVVVGLFSFAIYEAVKPLSKRNGRS